MLALYGILTSPRTVMRWRVQKRAARWITNKHDRTTSVTSLLQQLHLELLEERRRISQLTFLYKILNEHVAVLMNHLDLVLCDRPVRGPTTKQKLKIPRCTSTRFQKSFAARTITEWNSLPDSITSLASVSSFRSQLSAILCPQMCTLHYHNILRGLAIKQIQIQGSYSLTSSYHSRKFCRTTDSCNHVLFYSRNTSYRTDIVKKS